MAICIGRHKVRTISLKNSTRSGQDLRNSKRLRRDLWMLQCSFSTGKLLPALARLGGTKIRILRNKFCLKWIKWRKKFMYQIENTIVDRKIEMKKLKFKRSFSGPCAPTRHSGRRVLSRWWDEPCAIFSSGRGCPVKKESKLHYGGFKANN